MRTEILKGIEEDGSEDWDNRKDGGGKRNKKLAKETKMMNKRNEEQMGEGDDTIDIIAMTCPYWQ